MSGTQDTQQWIQDQLNALQAQPKIDTTGTPADGTRPSWTSLFGDVLAGGQGPGYQLRGSQVDVAGNRALLNFGINMLLASGPHAVRPDLFSAAAEGLQGAQQSLGVDQQRAAAAMGAQQEYAQKQQEMQLARIKEMIPLLRMQQGANIPNTLLTGTQTTPTPTNIATGGSIAAAGKDDFVQKFTPLAQVVAAQTGLPVDYVIGQAGLETGWGKSSAAANNNFFGITDPKTGKLMSYASPQEGITAYTQLMQSDRYKSVPRTGTPAEIGDRMAQAGYNPNVPAKDKTDSYGARVGAFAGAAGQPQSPGAAPAAPTAQTPPVPAPRAPIGTPADALPAGGATVAGPAGAAVVGAPKPPGPAVPSDVNAIIAGMTGAGANAGTLAPGGAVSAPQAPAQVATTAPVVPQTQTQTPPATPGGKLTFEQFQAQHPIAIDPTSYAVTPPSLADALAAKQTAGQQLALARQAGDNAAATKANESFITASDKVAALQQQAQAKSLELQQAAQKNALDTQRQLYDAEMQRVQAAEEADKKRAADAALETQRGQQAIDLEKVKAGQTWHQKLQEQAAQYAQENTLKPMSVQAAKSHQMNLGLSQLLPVLQDLPKGGGALGAVLDAHPDLAPLFNTAGILNDRQADAVRLINGLVSNISTEMKPAGLGALREYEWDAFKAQLPSMLSTPAGQQKAVALLMNMNNRISDEHSWTNSYFSRKVPDETTPGKMVPAHNLESDDPKESIQQRMDRELGPIIPSYSGPSTGSGQAQWEQSLPPGKPYYKTWAVPDPKNPGQPRRDPSGNIVTTKTLEVRPWQ
jgi:hypothetical protein